MEKIIPANPEEAFGDESLLPLKRVLTVEEAASPELADQIHALQAELKAIEARRGSEIETDEPAAAMDEAAAERIRAQILALGQQIAENAVRRGAFSN
jgi:hypothetical protein